MRRPAMSPNGARNLFTFGAVMFLFAVSWVSIHRFKDSLTMQPTTKNLEQDSKVSDGQTKPAVALKTRTIVGYEWVEWSRTDERVTIYTFTSDPGGPHRTTAALNFLPGNKRPSAVGTYPVSAIRLSSAHGAGLRFCAVPWDWRIIHESIEDWGKGRAWHTFAVMFPDRDQVNVYWPIDRVPKWRKVNGLRVRQTAFDIFNDMPDDQANAIGDPEERVIIYKRTPVYSDEPNAHSRVENGWPLKKERDTP